jgi:hypothetical protein
VDLPTRRETSANRAEYFTKISGAQFRAGYYRIDSAHWEQALRAHPFE